jgi:hypothetical protein
MTVSCAPRQQWFGWRTPAEFSVCARRSSRRSNTRLKEADKWRFFTHGSEFQAASEAKFPEPEIFSSRKSEKSISGIGFFWKNFFPFLKKTARRAGSLNADPRDVAGWFDREALARRSPSSLPPSGRSQTLE